MSKPKYIRKDGRNYTNLDLHRDMSKIERKTGDKPLYHVAKTFGKFDTNKVTIPEIRQVADSLDSLSGE